MRPRLKAEVDDSSVPLRCHRLLLSFQFSGFFLRWIFIWHSHAWWWEAQAEQLLTGITEGRFGIWTHPTQAVLQALMMTFTYKIMGEKQEAGGSSCQSVLLGKGKICTRSEGFHSAKQGRLVYSMSRQVTLWGISKTQIQTSRKKKTSREIEKSHILWAFTNFSVTQMRLMRILKSCYCLFDMKYGFVGRTA